MDPRGGGNHFEEGATPIWQLPKGSTSHSTISLYKIVDFQTLIDILKSIFASFNVAVAVEEEKPKTPRRFKLTARVQLPGKLRFVLTVEVSL